MSPHHPHPAIRWRSQGIRQAHGIHANHYRLSVLIRSAARRNSGKLTGSNAKPRMRSLAHECGINRIYLSGVERSERNVSIDNIARIARGLKVKASELLTDT
jgi:transcriptional regulator with XRE-family HTH domain